MSLALFDYMERYDYENLFLCQDRSIGLKAVIAIHDTTLGPATGGCRMWTYGDEDEGIEDALRLARGMTYKYAAAGVNLGGGKAVILGDPKRDKSEALFRSLGRFIHRLGGMYITGEDVGTTLRDMEWIRLETPFVVTLPSAWGGAGPISPATALGVLQSMRACLEEVHGSADLDGRSVAVQGVGSVGFEVVKLLEQTGARVIIGDVDVYCPCALGGVINDYTVEHVRARIIAGSANNQLQEERHGDRLDQRKILYAPDYICNAGGTIYDTDRLLPGGMNQQRAMENVRRIYDTMREVIRISKAEQIPTYLAADRFAERRIATVGRARSLASSFDARLG
jgi:leucine dehydrogenase